MCNCFTVKVFVSNFKVEKRENLDSAFYVFYVFFDMTLQKKSRFLNFQKNVKNVFSNYDLNTLVFCLTWLTCSSNANACKHVYSLTYWNHALKTMEKIGVMSLPVPVSSVQNWRVLFHTLRSFFVYCMNIWLATAYQLLILHSPTKLQESCAIAKMTARCALYK